MQNGKMQILKEVTDVSYLYRNDDISSREALTLLYEFRNRGTSPQPFSADKTRFGILKSFLCVFNMSCYADLTLVLHTDDTRGDIVESAGSGTLLAEINQYFNEDPLFFHGMNRLDIHSKRYKLFHETMNLDSGNFTVLTVSESNYFRPSKFHILCDIVLDIIRFERPHSVQVYTDYFDSGLIKLSQYLLNPEKGKCAVYAFLFNHVSSFFTNSGIPLILELSESIMKTFSDFIGTEAGIFRLSLSMFIIVIPEQLNQSLNFYNTCREKSIDFIFRGIILPYHCMNIPYESGQSVYSLFEDILFPDGSVVL